MFAFERLVAELASLLPPLLVLIHFPLHLLHLLSEGLADLHLPHVVGLLLLLSLPLHVLVLVILLALQELRGLQLSLAVTVQGLMFFVADLRGGLVESALDLLTLIVKVRLLLLQTPEFVVEGPLHLFFIPPDLVLDLHLLMVEKRALIVDTRLILVHARHTRIVSGLHV